MSTALSDQLDWYKDAIIYELHLKAFYDANGDGIGDLRGLIEKLDYLQDLGITAIWLLPFFPSPFRDDGYDVSDYRNIDQAYGTLSDFRLLVRELHRRGMRIIIELVVNHTSDQHPWFQRARNAKRGSMARDFYVWSDNNEKYQGTRIIFTDTEKSNWTWDPVASAFYWHRFFSHQPDLNFDNPHVVRAVLNIMRYWADLGVDGFRLDAIPYLCEREGSSNENLPETHAVIKTLRAELSRQYPSALLLAEANQWPEDVKEYFGAGDECHMAYHFPLMPRIYMAIAREDRHPITDIMRQTPEIPKSCQWAIFLRNHDELTLEMVTDSERDYLWSTYAADRRARVNLGIRRRLAPLMQNERRKIELMNALLLSMPGTPIIYYGDEVGMGDNIYLGDRDGVRTPMQWTPDRNGGFSRADPARLCLPLIMDAVYGYQSVSVEAHSHNLSSLLNWMKRLISVRQSLNVFGRGSLTFLYPSNRTTIAYVRQHEDVTVLCVMNLSRSAQAVELDLAAFVGRVPVELLGQTAFPVVGTAPYLVTLQGYGFFWFNLTQPADGAAAVVPVVPELVTLVVTGGLASLVDGRNRRILETDVFPPYLRTRRWFGQKNDDHLQTALAAAMCFKLSEREFCWTIAEARTKGAKGAVKYSLPLIDEWQAGNQPPASSVVARLRRSNREGYLADALHNEEFVRGMLDALIAGSDIETSAGTLTFRPSPGLLAAPKPEKPTIRLGSQEQSNTSAVVEDFAIIKFYRRVATGTHPEIEMGRFLTEAGFANAPAYYGSLHLVDRAKKQTALGVMHALVRNQGDGWSYTLAYLDRFLEESRVAPAADEEPATEAHAVYLEQIDRLALRTAEFHRALYVEHGDPAFAVEAAGADAVAQWAQEAIELFRRALGGLMRRRRKLSKEAVAILDDLAGRRQQLFDHIRSLGDGEAEIRLSRCHGDYHLGQILIVQNDVFIVDLEGAPQIPLSERRAKHCVVRDVACMLRSFDYAAWTALDRATTSRPDHRNDLRQATRLWREQVGRHFLDSYVAAMDGCPLWPQDEALARRILALFMIEKAALEILYELGEPTHLGRSSPRWAAISVAGSVMMGPTRMDNQAEAIVRGVHDNPFGYLGPHELRDGGYVIRTFQPGARFVELVERERGTVVAASERHDDGGEFFEIALATRPPFPYALRVNGAAGTMDIVDPYQFGPWLGDTDLYLFREGTHQRVYERLGAHPVSMAGVDGVVFAVWAPNAARVSIVGDFNGWDHRRHPMRLHPNAGVWEIFIPGVAEGERYKYAVLARDGQLAMKADPVAFAAEKPPATASVVSRTTHHPWSDQRWMEQRRDRDLYSSPMAIYEVHLGSWRRRPEEGNRYLTYGELAATLVPYVKDMGFTHIELLPIAEYPFDGSWGYQPTALYAPTSRFGTPTEFQAFVDTCHQAELGVLIDWVPGHFPNDRHGLAEFDGTHLYEHADPRQGIHRDWDTLIYNLGRAEVAEFLQNSALFWIGRHHLDGLRVDAVASMLYLDYSRKPGEWVPNRHGGNENLEAIAFLQQLNKTCYGLFPGAVTIAEESTAWPRVSRPTFDGGLGFGFKWNMGWMHDTLAYMSEDPINRSFHHDRLTFGLLYAFTENFVLPLSHDEVVHGKRSILGRMPGDRWQKFANLRAYYGFMYGHPGKKLLFMGNEFAQKNEWNHDRSLDWHLLGDTTHQGVMALVRELNALYRRYRALHELDHDPAGFAWIDAGDRAASVISFQRRGRTPGDHVVVAVNFTPVAREHYRIGVPENRPYTEIFNSDAPRYGGSGVGNAGVLEPQSVAWHGHAQSLALTLPPLAAIYLAPAS